MLTTLKHNQDIAIGLTHPKTKDKRQKKYKKIYYTWGFRKEAYRPYILDVKIVVYMFKEGGPILFYNSDFHEYFICVRFIKDITKSIKE